MAPRWPVIDVPELVERLGFDQAAFEAFVGGFTARLPTRAYDAAALGRALGYPWERPERSFALHDLELADPAGFDTSGRSPLLAIGSNGAPGVLRLKFAHFTEPEDRSVLVVTGQLHGFDVGAAAHPTVTYGSLPATLFPSLGTAVRAALLWLTAAQFAQLTWSELTYRLGHLDTRFEADEGEDVDGALVFVSRWGAFAPDGEPVALAAVSARDRRAPAWTQEQLLDRCAALALGDEARAADLVRAIHERPAELIEELGPVRAAGVPFADERFTPYPAR